MNKLIDDSDHEYSYVSSHKQICIEQRWGDYSVWLTKQDLLDMLKLLEEQESK